MSFEGHDAAARFLVAARKSGYRHELTRREKPWSAGKDLY
jgi:hypothetical protein